MDYIKVSEQPERRICSRNNFARNMLIKLDNGTEIAGISNDVSLGGVSLDVAHMPTNIEVGQLGKLYIKMTDASSSQAFICCLTRIKGNSLGIQIDKKEASRFGITLTKSLFKRRSVGGKDVHKNR